MADLVKNREEFKKTVNELCNVRAEFSSLEERCTVLQIIETDLKKGLLDKEAALTQSAVEMKAMEREKVR